MTRDSCEERLAVARSTGWTISADVPGAHAPGFMLMPARRLVETVGGAGASTGPT
jgi:hypothetical protein